MAKYSQVSYGSKGDAVKQLQTQLNSKGYNLSVDGYFGSKTQAAVKDYQKKNGLSVDGVVGDITWGSLMGGSSSSSTSGKSTASSANTGFQYKAYTASDSVKQAEKMLKDQISNKPGEYQSNWQDQLSQIMDKILNREDFSYDLNGDALYQQYKDQYTTQGKMAMMDTIGQASAMTGGFGNSYAQYVGQQTYQGYLQKLNDKVPELYQLALDKYNQEGDDLYNQYSMLFNQDENDYGRYRDQVSDYYSYLSYLNDKYNAERDFDYSKYSDDKAYAYQDMRDKISDEQWQSEFDEAKRQFDQQYALSASKSSGSSSGGSSSKKSSRGASSKKSSGGSTSSKSGGTSGKTYNNGMTSAEIESAAYNYYKAHPNVALDSRTLDMWLNDNGYGGESATAFKAYLQSYGATTSRR